MKRLKQINSEYVKFTIGGIIAAVFELLLTFFLTEFFKIKDTTSYGISLIIGTYLVFKYHKYITFDKHDRPTKRLVKFYTTVAVTTILNWILVKMLIKKYQIYYIFSIVIITISLQILNFLISKCWVFRQYPRK